MTDFPFNLLNSNHRLLQQALNKVAGTSYQGAQCTGATRVCQLWCNAGFSLQLHAAVGVSMNDC